MGFWISLKEIGNSKADGITYYNNEILRDHLVRRQRYNNVRLLYSEDWTVFNGSNWWISVVGQPYSHVCFCQTGGVMRMESNHFLLQPLRKLIQQAPRCPEAQHRIAK